MRERERERARARVYVWLTDMYLCEERKKKREIILDGILALTASNRSLRPERADRQPETLAVLLRILCQHATSTDQLCQVLT